MAFDTDSSPRRPAGMMTIGEAAAATGVSAKLIRYYEGIGLVRAVVRTGSGYRMYADTDIQALRFIRRARGLGFPIERIQQLLALWQDPSRASAAVRTLAMGHVEALEAKAEALRAMAETLRDLTAQCRNDARSDCPILAGLEQPERDAARARRLAAASRFAA